MPPTSIRITPFLLIVGGLLLWTGVATATTAQRLSVEELTAHAAVIVTGEVGNATMAWDDARRGIWTSVPVAVDAVIKNSLGAGAVVVGESLSVSVRGGRVGDIEQAVPGAPRFVAGSRVMIFLWEDRTGRLRVVGLVQGVFTAVAGAEETSYRNSYAGLCLIDTATGGAAEPDAYRPQELTVGEVEALLPAEDAVEEETP